MTRPLSIVIVLLLLAPGGLALAGSVPSAAIVSHFPSALSLTVVPSKLPADNLSYAAVVVSLLDAQGNPSVAVKNVTVYLTSSQEDVGTIPGQITIIAGSDYVLANFTTTSSQGTSTITASAPGLSSAQSVVSTVTPSGFPTHLVVYLVSSTFTARPDSTGIMIVQLEDDTGLPAKAISDVDVSLSTSYNSIASLSNNSLVIPAGSISAYSTFQTSYVAGTASITAVASGFISGSAQVTVVGPQALALNMQAQPAVIPRFGAGRLLISVTDTNGDPARAPSNIPLQLRVSNLTVADAQLTATIPAGQNYAIVSYNSSGPLGQAQITVSSPGLASSTATVQVANASYPLGLSLFIGPTSIEADNGAYRSIVVGLVGLGGLPAVASRPITIQLSSSNSLVGSVNSTLTIGTGADSATVVFVSSLFAGSTTITASATDLLPAQSVLTSFGTVPTQLALVGVPATLPADGGSYRTLEVMLEDSTGAPAVAPTAVAVQLSSSVADVALVNATITIPAGSIFTLTSITTSTLAGGANITASSPGLAPSGLLISTVVPAPSQLAAYVAPATSLLMGGSNRPLLAIQLQDASGDPARARQATEVIITSSNGGVLNGSISLTIPVRQDYVAIFLPTVASGSTTITASSPGLSSVSVPIVVGQSQLGVNITALEPFIYTNQTSTIKLDVFEAGTPLTGAAVQFESTSGYVLPTNITIGPTGEATVTFTPGPYGRVNVTAIVVHPAIGEVTINASLLVAQIPPKPAASFTQVILRYLLYLVILIAVVIALSGFLFYRWFRTQRQGSLDDELNVQIFHRGWKRTAYRTIHITFTPLPSSMLVLL